MLNSLCYPNVDTCEADKWLLIGSYPNAFVLYRITTSHTAYSHALNVF